VSVGWLVVMDGLMECEGDLLLQHSPSPRHPAKKKMTQEERPDLSPAKKRVNLP